MERRILIIGSPDEDAPYVRVDMANYRQFFLSPLGGAWRAAEITTLESPSKRAVEDQLEILKKVDYSVVVFAGHGHHPKRAAGTRVVLQPSVEFEVDNLKLGAPKHTLIVDCCRKLAKELVLDSVMAKSARAIEHLNPVDCRRYFDMRLSECSNGLVTLYSCSIDEVANEASDGGYYSSALVKAAEEWWRGSQTDTTKSYSILDVIKAHDIAAENVKRRSGQRQNPAAEYPRHEKKFPFAILA